MKPAIISGSFGKAEESGVDVYLRPESVVSTSYNRKDKSLLVQFQGNRATFFGEAAILVLDAYKRWLRDSDVAEYLVEKPE